MILIVEDDPALCETILAVLTLEGFEACAAPDGATGLQMIGEHRPTLVLSDIGMPGLNGYEMVAQMRQNPVTATIPVVFVTARRGLDEMQHAVELGAVGWLSKPFSVQDLIAAVQLNTQPHRCLRV
ncbi:MAG: response regulator [Anaerolineae bacterium]|nr:response regulator [Anaerolineae bacterium]